MRLKPIHHAIFWPTAIVLVALIASGQLNLPPETPGTQQNIVLGELVQKYVDEEVAQMSVGNSPGLIPAAQANARAWLKEIVDVVSRCDRGRGIGSKYNHLRYDITLKDGTVLREVYGTIICSYRDDPPVWRVRFIDGRAVDALTDGRERTAGVDDAAGAAHALAKAVVRADWDRSRQRYFPPRPAEKTQADFDREWGAK